MMPSIELQHEAAPSIEIPLIFPSSEMERMANQFVQYHKVSEGNPLPSEFAVHTVKPKLVKKGDFVWLLAGHETTSRKRFEFVSWFEVDAITVVRGETVIQGSKGRRLEPPWSVSRTSEPWFDTFVTHDLGSGAFGFGPIPAEYLSKFEERRVPIEDAAVWAGESLVTSDLGDDDEGPDDERQEKAVLTRRGQRKFRDKLLGAYQGRCAVTGSRVAALLEAAHLVPHAEGGKYELANGILLRADIHTLFDMRLLGIDSHLRVHLAKTLQFSEYKLYQDKRVEILPDRSSDQPRSTALEKRFALFQKEENIRTDALPKTSGR